MRVVAQNVAVFEGPGLALVRIAHQIFRARKLARHEAPLEARRKTRPAAPAQRGFFHLGDKSLRRRLLGEDSLQRRIAAALEVVVEPPIVAVEAGENDRVRSVVEHRVPYACSAIHWSIFAGVMKDSIFLLSRSMTGASPQAPKHSPSFSVKRPSAVVSFQSMPSFFFRCCAASSAPESAHGRLVQMHSLCLPTGFRSYIA